MTAELLPALTIHQPWARLIAQGYKPLENRTWAPPKRILGGYLAIHAGKKWDPDEVAFTLRGVDALLPAGVSVTLAELQAQLGCIVAVARVVGSVSTFDWTQMTAKDRPWFIGPIGWVLDSVVAIEPVPCKGAQGLWRVPPDVLDVVRERWSKARAPELRVSP